MTRSELIEKLELENPHLSREECMRMIDIFFESIIQTLEAGARVELRGFGTFLPRYRPPRRSRNPRNGESIMTKGKYVPYYKPAQTLANSIKEGKTA